MPAVVRSFNWTSELTVEGDLLVGQQIQHLAVDGVVVLEAALALGEHVHHVGGGLARVRARGLVRVRLVRRPAPRAPDALVAAARQPGGTVGSSVGRCRIKKHETRQILAPAKRRAGLLALSDGTRVVTACQPAGNCL